MRSPTGQDRIKAIHHLAAGNHRVYIIFSQFLTRDSLDDLVQPVMQTLDELTPYYQARMQWLSPQQRKIIELLCDRRYAVPVKEIAQRCFISHQTASSQLKDLLNKGYVAKESRGRESFYELQEPLMRICLEVKKQRGEPIKLFIDFLRIWYTKEELKFRLDQLPNNSLEKKYILKALQSEPLQPSSLIVNKNNIDDLSNKRGRCKKESYKICLSSANEAIKINSEDYKPWICRGNALTQLGKYEEAIQSYKKAIELNPKSDCVWINYGNPLFKMGRYEEAIQSYNKAIELNPKDHQTWFHRGYALSELGRYEEAIQSYNKAIELNPEDEETLVYRGNVLRELGRYEEAIQSYDKAIELNPEDEETLVYRGNVLRELGRYKEAIQSYDKAIEINPEYYWTWLNYGYTLSESGRYEEAIQSYDKAIKLNPEDHQTWFHRGNALRELDRYEEAVKSYNEAIKTKPKYYEALFNLGEVFLKLNRWDQGFTSIKNALNILGKTNNCYAGDVKEITKIILESKQDRETWRYRIQILVEIYDHHQLVTALGKGITENIPNLLSDMVSNKAARTWLEVWQEVGGDKPGLEIPLRWLKTAVEYKETKSNRKVLFQLPREERDLFETLL